MKVYFITGTDTGVGKTLAAALLCRSLSKTGKKTAYVKAVQTGGEDFDVNFVQKVCGEDFLCFCPLTFALPASPHLAAAQEGKEIDVPTLVRSIKVFSEENELDYLVVEGAGGISVPLNDQWDMAGLCQLLGGEAVIVTRPGLGTLNHTYLTVEYAKLKYLQPSLIISGCHSAPDLIEQDNLKRLSQMVEDRALFQIPEVKDLDTEECQYDELPDMACVKR
jgi:dethiobiotin synthetase